MCASLLVSLLSASPFSSLWGAHNIEFWRCCSSCPCSPGLSDTLFQMRRVCMCTCLIGWTRLLLLQDQTQTGHQQPDSFSSSNLALPPNSPEISLSDSQVPHCAHLPLSTPSCSLFSTKRVQRLVKKCPVLSSFGFTAGRGFCTRALNPP